jgi:hypothetical protein
MLLANSVIKTDIFSIVYLLLSALLLFKENSFKILSITCIFMILVQYIFLLCNIS